MYKESNSFRWFTRETKLYEGKSCGPVLIQLKRCAHTSPMMRGGSHLSLVNVDRASRGN